MGEKRYFYSDPLAAAWMTMVHGFKMRVKLRCGTFCAMGDWLVMPEREKYFERAVIHSDSLPLLEPRDGDRGVNVNDEPVYFESGSWQFFDGIDLGCYRQAMPCGPFKIERRGKLHFHSPESEAV